MNKNNKACRRMVTIPVHVNNAAQKVIERHSRQLPFNNGKNDAAAEFATSTAFDALTGAGCKNNGCTAVCTNANFAGTQCVYHRGNLISNEMNNTCEGVPTHLHSVQQYWNCCWRKSTNLLGCTTGVHHWIKRQRMDRVRHDWFNRAGLVHVSIFCRSAVPQGTRVESDGLKLNVTVAHGFGALETVKQFDLFGEIVPSESVMLISEKKVELVLKQLKRESWISLCYETGIVGAAVCDGEGAFLVDDDGDGQCYIVT